MNLHIHMYVYMCVCNTKHRIGSLWAFISDRVPQVQSSLHAEQDNPHSQGLNLHGAYTRCYIEGSIYRHGKGLFTAFLSCK